MLSNISSALNVKLTINWFPPFLMNDWTFPDSW